MTLLYYDPLFLAHNTGSHPENRTRLEAIWRRLEETGLAEQCARPAFAPVIRDRVERVHEGVYLDQLAEQVASGGGRIEADTVTSRDSWAVAQLAAGAACDAVRQVMIGTDRTALCLVRPPGHHALPDGAMGFCLLNNVAIAARAATEEFGLERLLIVDWDVHHGNGTQDIFWRDPRVGFFSIHRWPFYPGTGRADETGGGDALGTKLNAPIEFGVSRSAYRNAFRRGLETIAAKIKPQLVIVSAGFDAHRDDPIGSLDLDTEDFGSLTSDVLAVANSFAEGRVVSVLEGGYDPPALAASVELHLRTLLMGT